MANYLRFFRCDTQAALCGPHTLRRSCPALNLT